MDESSVSIYQSGQNVPVKGWYEIVGGNPHPTHLNNHNTRPCLHELQTGETFPNYDGRAVCWRLLQNLAATMIEQRQESRPN